MGAAARQPVAGALVLALIVAALFVYARTGYGTQGIFLLFGAGFGVIFQRSRFCLVRAFREPFLTGDAEHTRAAALALVVSMLGFAILKFTDLKDKTEWVFPAAGIGALAGGLAFGIGMTLAGGLMYAGVDDYPTRQGKPLNGFAPRGGFAYSLTDKTVLRGGYGFFWVPTIPSGVGESAIGARGYSASTTFLSSTDSGLTPAGSLINPFPNGVTPPQGNSLGLATGGGSVIENGTVGLASSA